MPSTGRIGCGAGFKGVYERDRRSILAFDEFHAGRRRIEGVECDISDTEKMDSLIGSYAREELVSQIELLDGASFDFDLQKVRTGRLSPVFFGSALQQFRRGGIPAALSGDDHAAAGAHQRGRNHFAV